MKVVLLDSQVIKGYPYALEQKIIEGAGHEFVKLTCQNEDEVIAQAKDADAILNIALKMTEKSISQLEKCQVMVRYGIGVDEFDIPAATKKGIKICNVTTYCIEEVAIHATSLMLAVARQLKHFDSVVAKGVWNQDLGATMRRPTTQTVGLIGFGNIARMFAKNLAGLGYKVVAYDPYVSDDTFAKLNVEKLALDELYKKADIISLHLPQTDETHHMLNKETFATMKDGVIIVNASRGGLINTGDLVDALASGKVGGAGLDVLETEPMNDPKHPLVGLPNVIITPHIAYRTQEAAMELFGQVAQTAVDVLANKVPDNVLNKKELGL
ncbi:MAG: C-terminal binding protein [Defluviitaleaceae bacterium]|nr:C-terminal binding protein [Defluviitaleaceae bacterium]